MTCVDSFRQKKWHPPISQEWLLTSPKGCSIYLRRNTSIGQSVVESFKSVFECTTCLISLKLETTETESDTQTSELCLWTSIAFRKTQHHVIRQCQYQINDLKWLSCTEILRCATAWLVSVTWSRLETLVWPENWTLKTIIALNGKVCYILIILVNG